MLKKYLKTLSKINTGLINHIKYGDTILNKSIFLDGIPGNLTAYKKFFFTQLKKKEETLLYLLKEVKKEEKGKEKDIIIKEIKFKLEKINFLREVYDIEANKIDISHKIKNKKIDYDKYNKIFFGVTKRDIKEDYEIKKWIGKKIFFSKSDLLELIKYSNGICPDIKFVIGNYTNLSHTKGTIRIPNQEEYNLQTIISLFFHEITHYFRFLNGNRNLGFNYDFSDYNDLEEGFAIYNEYYYGNKITNYGVYNPYYDLCYNVLLKDIPKQEKIKEVTNILKQKGYKKEKCLDYYHRFYRYTEEGGKNLFLKDLIYTKGYKNVVKLLKKDPKNYEKIFAGKIGLSELKSNILTSKNNIETKIFFKKMVKKIQSKI